MTVVDKLKTQRHTALNHIRIVQDILRYAPVIDNEMAKELDRLKDILGGMNSEPRMPKQCEDALCVSQ